MIGIDNNTLLVYEGAATYGHGVWPTPLILIATLIESEDDWRSFPRATQIELAKYVFREDSFDPVTRVRRGRLYFWDGSSQPANWHVQQHPVLSEDVGSRDQQGRYLKQLLTYQPFSGLYSRLKRNPELTLVLGMPDAMTVWKIIYIERAASGEELLTLRARSSLGVLPDLTDDALPEDSKSHIQPALERVKDAAFRSSPIALVDQCRDAAQVVLSHWLIQQGDNPGLLEKDLGKVIGALKVRFPEKQALLDAANLIRLLHPRGKSNEQQRLGVRPPGEEDGQLALSALGFLIRDIGWGARKGLSRAGHH